MKELPVLEAYHKNPKQLGLYDCRKERGACKENKSCRLIRVSKDLLQTAKVF